VQLTGASLMTGKPLKRLAVSYPKLDCAPDATFTDPSGDANEVLVSTPLPSAPAVDLVRGYITWDAVAKTVTFHAAVKDLSQDPPAGSTGEELDFGFGVGGKGYFFEGTHDAVAGDSADIASPLRTTVSNDVTFKVDKPHNEFTFTMPADALAKISSASVRGPVLKPGTTLTGLAVTMRRSEASSLVPNADEGAGQCPFIVPRHGSIHSFSVPGFLPGAASGGGGLIRDELPSIALAGLLGALAAAVVSRRRRWSFATVA
jgi:hypothetical protein